MEKFNAQYNTIASNAKVKRNHVMDYIFKRNKKDEDKDHHKECIVEILKYIMDEEKFIDEVQAAIASGAKGKASA